MKCLFLLFVLAASTCEGQRTYKSIGMVERYDSSINNILSPTAKAEIIAEGFEWSEGPLWIESMKMLLFSDVPKNTIWKWTEEKGTEPYLTPSGYTDTLKRGGETGSNGLILDNRGALVLCQHGDRRMAMMDAPIERPIPKFKSLAKEYEHNRFNSPNDAVYNSKGELFFTDPPYGLEKGMNDPLKEIPFQGVYKVKSSGEVELITDTLTRPNGIAFFPDEKTFLVANSDGQRPNWYAYDIDEKGKVSNGRIFYSAAGYDRSWQGGIDGLKIDKN
jgi:gluconolactonase